MLKRKSSIIDLAKNYRKILTINLDNYRIDSNTLKNYVVNIYEKKNVRKLRGFDNADTRDLIGVIPKQLYIDLDLYYPEYLGRNFTIEGDIVIDNLSNPSNLKHNLKRLVEQANWRRVAHSRNRYIILKLECPNLNVEEKDTYLKALEDPYTKEGLHFKLSLDFKTFLGVYYEFEERFYDSSNSRVSPDINRDSVKFLKGTLEDNWGTNIKYLAIPYSEEALRLITTKLHKKWEELNLFTLNILNELEIEYLIKE